MAMFASLLESRRAILTGLRVIRVIWVIWVIRVVRVVRVIRVIRVHVRVISVRVIRSIRLPNRTNIRGFIFVPWGCERGCNGHYSLAAIALTALTS